jgi:hypothetical protein
VSTWEPRSSGNEQEREPGGHSRPKKDHQILRPAVRWSDLSDRCCRSMLIPKTYTGRIWIYGTNLALLFAAMLNLLRIQNASMRGVRAFCITANVAMSAFFVALMIASDCRRRC